MESRTPFRIGIDDVTVLYLVSQRFQCRERKCRRRRPGFFTRTCRCCLIQKLERRLCNSAFLFHTANLKVMELSSPMVHCRFIGHVIGRSIGDLTPPLYLQVRRTSPTGMHDCSLYLAVPNLRLGANLRVPEINSRNTAGTVIPLHAVSTLPTLKPKWRGFKQGILVSDDADHLGGIVIPDNNNVVTFTCQYIVVAKDQLFDRVVPYRYRFLYWYEQRFRFAADNLV